MKRSDIPCILQLQHFDGHDHIGIWGQLIETLEKLAKIHYSDVDLPRFKNNLNHQRVF